jgi:hypothetical protein
VGFELFLFTLSPFQAVQQPTSPNKKGGPQAAFFVATRQEDARDVKLRPLRP